MKGKKLMSDGVLTTASSEGGCCCFVAGCLRAAGKDMVKTCKDIAKCNTDRKGGGAI